MHLLSRGMILNLKESQLLLAVIQKVEALSVRVHMRRENLVSIQQWRLQERTSYALMLSS